MIDAVQHVLQDKSVLNAGVYAVGCLAGQFIYWIRRWAVGEKWVLCNFKMTIAAITGNIGIMAGFLALGSVETLAVGTALFVGLAQGISADSIINRGERKPWSEGQRQDLTEKGK